MTSFSEAAAAAEALRARSQRLADGLRTAQQQEAVVESADQSVSARAAGRRLLTVTLGADADRMQPQQLAASIEEVVRAALAANAEQIATASAELVRGAT